MNKLFTAFSKLGIVAAFLVSFLTTPSVNAEVECKIDEITQFVTCYYVEDPEEITQTCPVIDPAPNCVYTEWGTDENNCPIPTETHCFGDVTPSPTITSTPFPSSTYQAILGIAEESNKHICSDSEKEEEFFFYEGEHVSVCGDYIKVSPPMGLADAPDVYYSNQVNNRDSFACNGYWAPGYQEDSRCAEISSCEPSEYSLCSNDIESSFCTSEYAPVCARHTDECYETSSGRTICPSPLPPATYSNVCEMNKSSNTQLIHLGECGTYTPVPQPVDLPDTNDFYDTFNITEYNTPERNAGSIDFHGVNNFLEEFQLDSLPLQINIFDNSGEYIYKGVWDFQLNPVEPEIFLWDSSKNFVLANEMRESGYFIVEFIFNYSDEILTTEYIIPLEETFYVNMANAQTSVCTAEYAPVCGELSNGVQKTYSNECMMNAEGALWQYPGACWEEPTIPQNCSTWFDGCNTCGVNNGELTFCTQMACFQNEEAYCMNYTTPTPYPEPTFYCPTPTPLPSLAGCEVIAEDQIGVSYGCTAQTYRYVCEDTTPPAGYEGEVITNENNPFEDTSSDTLEGQAAGFLYHNAVIGGFPDREFKGGRFVNRAEASKFITRILYNEVENNTSSSSFWDVKSGEWYVPYVEKAAELGLIQGYPDQSFRPADTINTAELLTIVARLDLDLDFNAVDLMYSDVSENDWFYNGALIAQEYNLFPNRGSLLIPDSLVTRNELAVVLYQLLKNQSAISLNKR